MKNIIAYFLVIAIILCLPIGFVQAEPIYDDVDIIGIDNFPKNISGSGKFANGVVDKSGNIWMVPVHADSVVKFDTTTREMILYNNWPIDFDSKSQYKFRNGVMDDNENLYLIPNNANCVIKLNTASGEMSSLNNWPNEIDPDDTAKFAAAVYTDGFLYLVPSSAKSIVKIDTSTGEMSTISNWPAGFNIDSIKFFGGVLDNNNCIWMIPCNANMVVKLDLNSLEMIGYNQFPNGIKNTDTEKFSDGVLGDNGYIYMIPNNSKSLVRLDSSSGKMVGYDNWTGSINSSATNKFSGGAFDGRNVWMSPQNASAIAKFDTIAGTMSEYDLGSANTNATAYAKYIGSVSNGESIYFIPYSAEKMVEVSSSFEIETSYAKNKAKVYTTEDCFIDINVKNYKPNSSIESVRYFRTATTDKNLINSDNFASYFNSADISNKESFVQPTEVAESNIDHKYTINADKNGTYWIEATIVKNSISYSKIDKVDITNIYSPCLYIKGIDTDNNVLYHETYSTEHGIPLDLDNTVLKNPEFGFDTINVNAKVVDDYSLCSANTYSIVLDDISFNALPYNTCEFIYEKISTTPTPVVSSSPLPDINTPTPLVSATPQPDTATSSPLVSNSPEPDTATSTPLVSTSPLPDITTPTPFVSNSPLPDVTTPTPVVSVSPEPDTATPTPLVSNSPEPDTATSTPLVSNSPEPDTATSTPDADSTPDVIHTSEPETSQSPFPDPTSSTRPTPTSRPSVISPIKPKPTIKPLPPPTPRPLPSLRPIPVPTSTIEPLPTDARTDEQDDIIVENIPTPDVPESTATPTADNTIDINNGNNNSDDNFNNSNNNSSNNQNNSKPSTNNNANINVVKSPPISNNTNINEIKNKPENKTITYTLSNMYNSFEHEANNFKIIDYPSKELTFLSGEIPKFNNGNNVTYSITYKTNKSSYPIIMKSNIPAYEPCNIQSPALDDGEIITQIAFEFSSVPAYFAQGNMIKLTFEILGENAHYDNDYLSSWSSDVLSKEEMSKSIGNMIEKSQNNLSKKNYSTSSWKALQDEIQAAYNIINDPNSTEEELNSSNTAIENALQNLEPALSNRLSSKTIWHFIFLLILLLLLLYMIWRMYKNKNNDKDDELSVELSNNIPLSEPL